MTDFPLVLNFEGDYGMKLLMVDAQDTMDHVIDKAKAALVGVVVKQPKQGTQFHVRRHGGSESLAGNITVTGAGFKPMEPIDIVTGN